MLPLYTITGLSSEYLDFTNFPIADPATLPAVSSSNYITWLSEWSNLIASCPTRIDVPQEACVINTPLSLTAWKSLLTEHPHQELVQFFTTGISNGFRIGFSQSKFQLKRARKNMQSADLHKQVVDSYLQEELSTGRVAGPFPNSRSDQQIRSDSKTSQTRLVAADN